MPLEHAAAKLLVKKGFAVDGEYTYSRSDNGVPKDFSIDVGATYFFNHEEKRERQIQRRIGSPAKLAGDLSLLVECKYRHQNIKWIFFPDPNIGPMSPAMIGGSIRTLDEFSDRYVPLDATVPFDKNARFAFGGVELNDSSAGEAHNSEIRRGLSQLQYGMARHLKEAILASLYFSPSENRPFFYAPILLTTAEIWMLKRNVDLAEIERSNDLTEVAEQIPWCIVYKDQGPDFELLFNHIFRGFSESINMEEMHEIERRRKTLEVPSYHSTPDETLNFIKTADREFLFTHFSHFIVCNNNHFEDVVGKIIHVTKKASATKQRVK